MLIEVNQLKPSLRSGNTHSTSLQVNLSNSKLIDMFSTPNQFLYRFKILTIF